MIKRIIFVFIAIAVMFAYSLEAHSSGLPEEISVASSDKNISLDLALEWLRGEAELPEEMRDVPISVPLFKHEEIPANKYGHRESQIKAITSVFRQYNNELDIETASEYAGIVKSTSEKFGEDPFIIAALVVIESTVNPQARSNRGDYGLMQVRWRVHRKNLMRKYPTMKTEKDMLKPVENITAGTEIFSNYRKSADGDPVKALVAYSGGSSTHWDKVNDVIAQIKVKYDEFYKG